MEAIAGNLYTVYKSHEALFNDIPPHKLPLQARCTPQNQYICGNFYRFNTQMLLVNSQTICLGGLGWSSRKKKILFFVSAPPPFQCWLKRFSEYPVTDKINVTQI